MRYQVYMKGELTSVPGGLDLSKEQIFEKVRKLVGTLAEPTGEPIPMCKKDYWKVRLCDIKIGAPVEVESKQQALEMASLAVNRPVEELYAEQVD